MFSFCLSSFFRCIFYLHVVYLYSGTIKEKIIGEETWKINRFIYWNLIKF